MRILHVVGTRPNLVKMAPVVAAMPETVEGLDQRVVHTGQHYDREMSQIFFDELGIREPDYSLGAGGGSHAQQTAKVLERIEPVLQEFEPDWVVVPGDVNSTLAAALAATKLGIPVAHVEAGLRSFDRDMPEEINRILTDQISDLLFIHSPEAATNLEREAAIGRVEFVGNTMIDTLVAMRPRIDSRHAAAGLGLTPGRYLLVTLHRPALVDGPLLAEAMARLVDVAGTIDVLFPVHPRTRKRLAEENIDTGGVKLIDPVGYIDFLSLQSEARAVLTDSGGVQEETTHLGVPCFTLRDNTERPVTIEQGTNTVLGLDPARISRIPELVADADRPAPGDGPALWDGEASKRIAAVFSSW